MDSLYWKNLTTNSKLKVKHTKKLFFNRYLYKLEVVAYGGQCINSTTQTIDEALEFRRRTYKSVNYAGSWVARMNMNISKADPDWLEYLQELKLYPPTDWKIRIEEPRMQFYIGSEKELIDFISSIPTKYRKYISSVYGPGSQIEQELLLSGKKLLKSSPEYKYRINLRDGSYEYSTRQAILSYLDGLGPLVRIPVHTTESMNKSYSNIWDCYIYSNDTNISVFLQLIHPRLVRSIVEMASAEDITLSQRI